MKQAMRARCGPIRQGCDVFQPSISAKGQVVSFTDSVRSVVVGVDSYTIVNFVAKSVAELHANEVRALRALLLGVNAVGKRRA